ncbi:PIG-L deacetylase family protein [Synoicihabitans lomoniglobus]|uniref:PIG-L family deacetylase n=1 Tax=Synoicihabitans lomoniglobus TaxID=2909285 RepID=A0AAF0CI03_9BACT|nr:PIG-L family deacetylase [Opitutaceae bacterium LMO-M01]WED64847.1 PIG-L family deacetylase [Opitutaceae bacterium LMO-M01]
MIFSRDGADVWVPGGGAANAALQRVTHLCIGAHQDDVEIMAHSAICACLDDSANLAFGGVVVTDGAGSSRRGPYADKTDDEMKVIRAEEQREAARRGRYAIQIQLAHPSAAVKDAAAPAVVADLAAVLAGCSPREVLLHNPADKHDTHVAVLLRSLTALRQLPVSERPTRVLGVEVWRGLDWMLDSDKVALDTSARPELRAQLLEVFDSQIFGGKRYDLATEGRRAANATFHDSHASDEVSGINWAMDLTPVVHSDTVDLADYTLAYIDRLRADVAARIARLR